MELDKLLSMLGKGSLWVLLGLAVSKILFFLVQVVIARHMGASVFGLISIGVALVAILSLVSMLGLDMGLKRFLPGLNSLAQKKLMSFSILATLLASLGFGAILYLMSAWLELVFGSPGLAPVLRVFAVSLPVYSFSVICLRALEGLLIMKYRFWIEGLLFGTSLFVLAYFLSKTGTAMIVSFAFFLSYFLMSLAAFIALERNSGISWNFSFRKGKELLRYSLPLSAYRSLEILIRYVNIVIVGLFMSEFFVGLYSAAVHTAVMASVILTVINPVFFPLASKIEEKEVFALYRVVSTWIVFLALPVFILAFVLRNDLMAFLFSPEFRVAGGVFGVLIAGFLVEAVAGPLEMLMSSLDMTVHVLANMLAGFAFTVLFAFLLIPSHGLMGAGLSFLLGITVQKALGLTELHFRHGILPFKKSWVYILSGGVVMGVFSHLVFVNGVGFFSVVAFLLASSAYYLVLSSFALDADDKTVFL